MAIQIKSTKDVSKDGVKCLIYGKAGIGKTSIFATAPNPIILSCESGLLALADLDLPYIQIDTIDELNEAYEYLMEDEEGQKYKTIGLDSISEIASVLLAELIEEKADARAAYGELYTQMTKMIRLFRDMKKRNVVFTAMRTRRTDDDTGITSYLATMPGQQLLNNLPYFFDEVLYFTTETDDDGVEHRVLKTSADFEYDAKDRSGKLEANEQPNLSDIFDKILGVHVEKEKKKVKKKGALTGRVESTEETE